MGFASLLGTESGFIGSAVFVPEDAGSIEWQPNLFGFHQISSYRLPLELPNKPSIAVMK